MAEATAETTQTRLTAAEYRELPETNQIQELLEGEIVMTPAAADEHQRISGRLHLLLAQLVPVDELRYAPADVQLDEENVVQPDVFWVKADNPRCKLVGKFWQGAPDLVIEILSPSTGGRDRGTKYDLYQQHGVREYWLVEPEARFLEVFVWQEGEFKRQGLYQEADTFTSPVLDGKTVEMSAIFGGQA